MDTPFHYEVRITNIRYVTKDNIEIDISTKTFTDENPFLSRQKSLTYYIDYISGLLEHLGVQYRSDKQSRDVLLSVLNNPTKESIITRDHEDTQSKTLFFGIGVFFINDIRIKNREEGSESQLNLEEIENEDLRELFKVVEENPIILDEQLIHGVGFYGSNPIIPENFINDLFFETKSYRKNKYDLTGKTIEVNYYDEETKEVDKIEILPTPFDWTGYDVPRGSDDEIVVVKPEVSLEQIITEGESNQVEFKPTLLYNFKTKEGGIGVKSIIGKTICGFLNSRGGILFIGLTDNGKPQGLSYDYSLSGDKNPRDFFILEFDEMLEHFLPQWVQDNVVCGFQEIEGVEVFIVIVTPSKSEPVFFKGQNGKEFYIRRMGSTKQLDIEQFYLYWKNHWDKETRE